MSELTSLSLPEIKKKLKKDLEQICKDNDLDATGKKADLVQRIWEFVQSQDAEG